MNLSDLSHRGAPRPWAEGDNIPWNEPGFSERMLKEHLSQEHDAASRRYPVIDQHIHFIHTSLLGERPARVLDLACGPGLYAVRLADLGHSVHGIDFSPASIAYARELAAGRACEFELNDLRKADFNDPRGEGYDLAMFLYGEFNVFRPVDARDILARACAALKPGGLLLLEPSDMDGILKIAAQPRGWTTQESGLFSARPHLLLSESFWDDAAHALTSRYYVVDAESAQVAGYAASYQAYTRAEFTELLTGAGFVDACFYPSLTGDREPAEFIVITAVKPGTPAQPA